MKLNTKSKILPTLFERRTLCFNLSKNWKLKIKLWCVAARERKKSAFFLTFILSKANLSSVFILSHWINFQNIYTFKYQKTLLHTLFYFLLKSSKTSSLSLSLRSAVNYFISRSTLPDVFLNTSFSRNTENHRVSVLQNNLVWLANLTQ